MTNEQHIAQCHPAIRERVALLLQKAKDEGINLKITFSYRSYEEQMALYNQPKDGKDNDGDGKIDEADEKVTNARGGQSFHNYGLAVDVVAIVNKKAIWKDEALWKKIGGIGKSCGFEWGGDWRTIKDQPHFEFPPQLDVSFLDHWRREGKVDKDGFVILT